MRLTSHHTSSEEATVAGKLKEMEAKKSRAAAIAAMCMLLLLMLPGQQEQVAASAKSRFCACYKGCRYDCRHDHVPRVACIPFCLNKCSPTQADAGTGDSCRAGCAGIKICDLSGPSADAADAAACMENCNEKWSHEPTK